MTEYGAEYYATRLGEPYAWDNPTWQQFNGRIANVIVGALRPRTVLDVGCGFGFLVAALRERGVDARGVETSDYALSQVPPGLRPFVERRSATDDLGGPYDLVTCIEVLEHLSETEAAPAVARLAAASHDVLFSSTPDDFAEPTHQNVRPPDYWRELFARHGFRPSDWLDASIVAPHAVFFSRRRRIVKRAVRSARWRLGLEGPRQP